MKIFIVAGGTGGHVYPALSVAREFKKKSTEVIWVGRKESLEEDIAKEEGFSISGLDWWDNKDGMKFLSNRMQDSSFDKLVDQRLMDLLNQGGVVITSYTLPWLTSNGISIWLEASTENRSIRLRSRDTISLEESTKIVNKRDTKNQQISI
mgnify:CR=1 FL=1